VAWTEGLSADQLKAIDRIAPGGLCEGWSVARQPSVGPASRYLELRLRAPGSGQILARHIVTDERPPSIRHRRHVE
jgi:hypothetical protein